MRAFLSHSSKNKDIVRKVFEGLGSALAEYDERTFESGSFNVAAISDGLSRSDVFVLFATPESLDSGYVELEIKLAQEKFAQKNIKKIITFCLEGVKPEMLPGILPGISAVRKITAPGPIARSIRSSLLDLAIENGGASRPFVGRDSEKKSITSKLSDPTNDTPAAMMLSGVDGVGRRSLAKKVFEDLYPFLPKIHPSISIISGSGSPEIFRELLSVNAPLSKSSLFEEVAKFDKLSKQEQYRRISEIIENVANQDQVLFVVDDGGLLLDDGSLNDVMKHSVEYLSKRGVSHPPLCFVVFRTPPGKSRESSGIVYLRVDPLSSGDMRTLVSLHFKRRRISVDAEQVEKIVELIDGHPYNLEYVLDLLDTTSLESLLEDPEDLLAFKRRQGDEFLSKMKLGHSASSVLSALRVLGTTPLQILSEVVGEQTEELGKALRSLEEQHCIQRSGDVILINRPLRSAIERSPQLRLSKSEISKIREKAVEVFKDFRDEDDIPASLISTAARAAALSNDEDSFLRLFLTPANAVIVARKFYDAKNYHECEKMCSRALQQERLITPEAALEARRLQCLTLIRLGRDDQFHDAVSKVDTKTTKGRALKPFLLGFRQRIRGYPSEACNLFEESLNFNPGAFSTLREISHAWLMQGDPKRAKSYCDSALSIAPTNPYVLDQALAIEISQREKVDDYIFYDPVVEDLLARLKKYGNEDGLSFYSIRMAEIFRRIGNIDAALDHIQEAKRLNPSHVPTYTMECSFLLHRGDDPVLVNKKLESIRPMIEGNQSGEGNTNLPEFLSLKVRVLADMGKIGDAVQLLKSAQSRLGGRVQELKRYLSFNAEGLRSLEPSMREFLRN